MAMGLGCPRGGLGRDVPLHAGMATGYPQHPLRGGESPFQLPSRCWALAPPHLPCGLPCHVETSCSLRGPCSAQLVWGHLGRDQLESTVCFRLTSLAPPLARGTCRGFALGWPGRHGAFPAPPPELGCAAQGSGWPAGAESLWMAVLDVALPSPDPACGPCLDLSELGGNTHCIQ